MIATHHSPMPKLVFKSRDGLPSHTVELVDGTYPVGRGADCRLVIPHGSVSSRHCEILVHGTEVIIRDAGSKNGTFVNGVRVKGQMPVNSGQRILFGIVSAELVLPSPPFFGDDDSRESAVFDHRRYMNRPATSEVDQGPVAGCKPPIPNGQSGAAEEPTIACSTVDDLHAASVRSPTVPWQETINLGESDPQPIARISLIWLYLGLATFALVLVWLLRRAQ